MYLPAINELKSIAAFRDNGDTPSQMVVARADVRDLDQLFD